MPKLLRELALLTVAAAMGTALVLISRYHVAFLGFGSEGWGYPYAWYTMADDYLGFMGSGVYWTNFGLDLAFWLAVSLAAVEGSFHIAIPYVRRKVVTRRMERNMPPTSTSFRRPDENV